MKCFWASVLAIGWVASLQGQTLELENGDRIGIIGNMLAERMQHDGWLETLIQSRFPDRELVVRNLAFSGDELTLRLRSADFGTPDEHLAKHKVDIIFAFFGYNESFAGPEGVEPFKQNLREFVEHSRSQQYNGRSAPQVVLFSPIPHENLGDPNLPDGTENNGRLAMYSQAMREVADSAGARFVDLMQPARRLYDQSAQPLTTNGIHLNTRGNRAVAGVIEQSLFGAGPARSAAALQRIRQAVQEKNFYWFNRYRTVDGYSIFGGRADLRFVNGQTNRVVMQREMEVLDVMTANRDRKIWARARGGDLEVDDSNAPPLIPVITNKPGKGPGGEHLFPGGEEAIEKMNVAKGMKVNLYASEEIFPELINPVQMAWDTKGRLWVGAWRTYPHWKPGEQMDDKLLILEDTDGDGRADVCKTFTDDLHDPTGFEFYDGGVLVAMAPDLLLLKDTDGDDKADFRERVLHGIDSADTHHTANSFTFDPGGALYFQEGTFHHTQVETPWGPPVRLANAGVFRFEPRTRKFEVYVSYPFANPHGHVWDRWGQDIVHDGTGAVPYHGTLFSGHVDFPRKHARPPTVYQQRTRPCPATEILSSRHFPDEMQGDLLVGNVIGFQGILRYRIEDDGSSLAGFEEEPILSSSDESFRPVDFEIGPDGALYFTDWMNPVIGHMQHNLRDPSRDQKHGRVYRLTYPSRPLLGPVPIAGQPIEKLVALLAEPEDRVRYRAKIELSARGSDAVLAAVKQWMAGLDPGGPNYEHHLLEALWMHQYHNVVNLDLLKRMLGAEDFRARAAAVKVLCYQRDRVPDSLEMLKRLAADTHPRVRLEAVRAASFYKQAAAVEVPLISTEYPTDKYLDYTRYETMQTLEPYWKGAIAAGEPLRFSSEAGMQFLVRNVETPLLLKMAPGRAVFEELLHRNGVRDEDRTRALAGLARLQNKHDLDVLLEAIGKLDESQQGQSVVFDLVRLLTGRSSNELAMVRPELAAMARNGQLPLVRQIGFAALITADGEVDNAWELGNGSVRSLRDVVGAMPLVADPALRAAMYPRVAPLLDGLPRDLADEGAKAKGTYGRYVRIELPGKRTLTLAEVEVYSEGVNVARRGKASQKNTANGGVAAKGIDGNKDGRFGAGGQTHSIEGTEDPWWEVDLGEVVPIDRIVVYNRTEGALGGRLRDFTLKVLDAGRDEVYLQTKIPAPEVEAGFHLQGGGAESIVRRAAMNAVTSVRGYESQTFDLLAPFVLQDKERTAAIRAMLRIGQAYFPPGKAPTLVDRLIAYIREIPAADRTSPAALDALELAGAMARLLPAEQASAARAELGSLGVRVIRLGTVPHRMTFDKDRLVVEAGKAVEIVVENNDIMPHNVVVTVMGALEEVGLLAEATATDPNAIARQYVPQSDKILVASRLLQPRESQKISFTAPPASGVYPYVCTYPGHWRRMYGALYVVDDLDAYLGDPDAYLQAKPLAIVDELLKFSRPRTDWKLDDLSSLVSQLGTDRSFTAGKEMFRVANCLACHRLNDVGIQVGPDLAKLDPKFQPADILREMLDPSAQINEKFYSYVFELESGKIVTGLVVEDTPGAVKVLEDPLAKSTPLVIKPSEIVSREKSKTSLMPQGLLDRLTREEILDLVAYVASRGDQNAKFFGGHVHGGAPER